MKNRFFIGLAVLAGALLISVGTLLAGAAIGLQDDPLVTLGYLTNIFRPQVMEDVRQAEQEAAQKFESRVAELESQLDLSRSDSTEVFSVVTLTEGQTLICSVGTEIMLRTGSANAFGDDPALVDCTSGAELPSGDALTANHMYLVTVENNGLTVVSDTASVLVRGRHSVND